MGEKHQEIVDKLLQQDTADSTITLGADIQQNTVDKTNTLGQQTSRYNRTQQKHNYIRSTITLVHKAVTLGYSRQDSYTKTQYIGQSHWTEQTGQLHYHTNNYARTQ